jgi:hypothetical protein
MNTQCPICNSDKHTVKISGIVSTGTTRGTFRGPTTVATYSSNGNLKPSIGITQLTGTTSTDLAKILSPYAPPKPPSGKSCLWWGFFIFVVGFIVFYLGREPFIGTTNMAGIFLTELILFSVYFSILFILNKKEKSKQKEIYDREYPRYLQYIDIWERCYYCQKDDIVFDPINGENGKPGIFPKY